VKKTGQRIPYSYDGTLVTSRKMSDLLAAEISRLGELHHCRPDLIVAAWPEVIGPKLADMTQAVSFYDGILLVKVRNSTLHSLLSRHDKDRILIAVKQKFPKSNVRNIVFRIG